VCDRERISVLDIPVSHWAAWVDQLAAADRDPALSLRRVIVGGESVPTRKVETWTRVAGSGAGLFFAYGPTEATVCATRYLHTPAAGDPGGSGRLPIGAALDHARVYVLDGAGDLVPPGVAGELHIGGDGVARGYLRRPDATAA